VITGTLPSRSDPVVAEEDHTGSTIDLIRPVSASDNLRRTDARVGAVLQPIGELLSADRSSLAIQSNDACSIERLQFYAGLVKRNAQLDCTLI
jgi:hypothetical protein